MSRVHKCLKPAFPLLNSKKTFGFMEVKEERTLTWFIVYGVNLFFEASSMQHNVYFVKYVQFRVKQTIKKFIL